MTWKIRFTSRLLDSVELHSGMCEYRKSRPGSRTAARLLLFPHLPYSCIVRGPRSAPVYTPGYLSKLHPQAPQRVTLSLFTPWH